MNTRAFEKFCPVCHLGIDANSIVCRHCGTTLDLTPPGKAGNIKDFAAGLASPAIGLAIYFFGTSTPIAVVKDKEFILGREAGAGPEKMVDLTNREGFAMGVSRRHAMVRAVENGYVIIDLNSSNGTWLNGQILMPNIVNELPSGSDIQLGYLKLVVIYQSPPGDKK